MNQVRQHWIIEILLAFTTLGAYAQQVPSVASTSEFSFMVAGHVYGAPNVVNEPFHPPFMQALEEHKEHLNFLVLTGDLVQEASEKSWDNVDNYLTSLPFPTVIAPGNHDLKNPEMYHTRYGATNYSFEIGDYLFVVLDLLESGWNLPEEKLADIVQKQEEHAYAGIFIFNHHLFWGDEKNYPDLLPNSTFGKAEKQTFYPLVLPQLRKLNVPIYIFAGDMGATSESAAFYCHRVDQVHLIASGMGAGLEENVVLVDVHENKLKLSVLFFGKSAPEDLEPYLISFEP